MAVLVTGGAGFIGSHMAWRLCDAGEDVVVVDNLSTGARAAVPPQARFVHADVGDNRLMRDLMRVYHVDAVMHFAGSIVVPESVENPLLYYENNTSKSRGLIAAAVTTDVRHFVFSSTAAIYAPGDGEPISETAEIAPATPYGHSKRMTEQMLADVARAHDFTYTALRYFNVSGADPEGRTGQSTPGATHLLKVACETALGKRPSMAIFGTDYPTPDGTGVRDFIHVTDLVEAHYLALQRMRGGAGNLVANCGYGRGYSVRELIASVRRISGIEFEVIEGPRRPGDLHAVISDPSLARRELGWIPRLDDLDTIVTHALAWEQRTALRKVIEAAAIESPEPEEWARSLRARVTV